MILAAGPGIRAEEIDDQFLFLREDWIISGEPTHNNYWGTRWAYNNLPLTFRALQRGKHELETRLTKNWLFVRPAGAPGGPKGWLLRLLIGAFGDFGLFMGSFNLHHAAGHDAAAREFNQAFGDRRSVPLRMEQILPKHLGGHELDSFERQPRGRGADANARAMTLPMEAENVFAHEEAKPLLSQAEANATAFARHLFYRGRFLLDLTEIGTLNQAFIDSQTPGSGLAPVNGPGFSTDFTWYLHYLNRDRYGVRRIDDYKLKMGAVKGAIYLQAADPLFWAAAYGYGRGYLARARNKARLPMLDIGKKTRYLPGLRVFFSPFGIEYFQDNHFRRNGVLASAYWTIGDNRYEKRHGAGIEVTGLALPRLGRLGFFAQFSEQPLLSRITDRTALSSLEVGRTHLAYNIGGSLRIPIWLYNDYEDPARIFLYARGGTKNLSWFPGEYLGAGTYLQTGLGVRL